MFQSTRPHGARPHLILPVYPRSLFQSTRPHGARLSLMVRALPVGDVSIHAPARGGDAAGCIGPAEAMEFQSTRPHGRDFTPRQVGQGPGRFNPRARTGRDESRSLRTTGVKVSIHAPARGATPTSPLPSGRMGFNPRARTGRDSRHFNPPSADAMFQSTRPHGARRCDDIQSVNPMLFQSTRPHGARPKEAK